jgi:hypothetical protein
MKPVDSLLVCFCIDSSTQIDAILLDFSKAFDKVSHERLAAKLHHYGVRGPTLNWIKSFLAGRTQRVGDNHQRIILQCCLLY